MTLNSFSAKKGSVIIVSFTAYISIDLRVVLVKCTYADGDVSQ